MSLSKDLLAYVPVKLIPAITGLLSIVILTRNLAPEEYGRYSVAITTALLLVQLAGSWLSNSVLYLYPDYLDEKARSEFRRQTINLQLIVSLPASVIAYFAIYMATQTHQLAIAGGILVLGQLMQGLLMTFLQSSRKIHTQAISVGLQSVFQIGTLCVLIFLTNGKAVSAVIAVTLGFFAGNIILLLDNKKHHNQTPIPESIISRKLTLKLLTYGMPMCMWFFATQFYMIGDRILIQFLGLNEQLGQYASFRDLATGCAGFLTMPLLMASHPIIMSKWKSGCDPQEIENLLSNNLIFLCMLFAPLIVMIDIVGHDLIIALFGQRYELPENIMVLVVISIFIGSVSIHLQKGLEVSGKTLLMAKLSLVTAIFSLLANIIILPRYGVPGGATVVVFSNIIYLMSVVIAARKILLPKIPVKFLIKISTWIFLVELILRSIAKFLPNHFNELGASVFNFICISIATIILFATDFRVRRFMTTIAAR